MPKVDYPQYVCRECAEKAGGRIPAGHIAGHHMGICPCCGEAKSLAAPRDYRYPKELKVLYEYRPTVDILGCGSIREPIMEGSF